MCAKWEQLCSSINAGDAEGGMKEAQRLVDSGETPLAIFLGGIEPCLSDIGDRFGRLEIFLPELMMAATVVRGIQELLLPVMQASGDGAGMTKGRIVIGTIFGDIHDIGKSIVRVLLQVNGYEVRDLGVAVPAAKLIEAAQEFEADIIGISGLMMPSLPYMKDAIALVKENIALADKFRVMVGGGPVTPEWAKAAGADGYASDAVTAVQEADRLMALDRVGS